jgi:hypothetical protein
MIACYDLAQCPPTYDVVAFLARAEIERLSRGEEGLDLRILPGPKNGFRDDLLWPQDIGVRESMLKQIVWPMMEMLPSMKSIRREITPNDATPYHGAFGAHQYMISLPSIMDGLRHGCRPLRPVSPMEKDPKLITITLRESDHHPRRNSNLGVWLKVAWELTKVGYSVTIIRDTARVDTPISFEGVNRNRPVVDKLASTDLHRRSQLYDAAILNLGVNNGPMWLAIFMNAPVMMFKVTTDIGGCYNDEFYRSYGLNRGGQLPTSPVYQSLVWEDDIHAESMVRTICNHLELLSFVDAALGSA